MNSKDLVSRMTLEEKASLCSGKDFWHLKGVERLGLSSVMVTDGPHGLRKQAGESDHLGINDSVKATCFPTASATACSFDPELMREIGAALGEECRQEDVAVILGPGANIKRSPLCGRNFEYISEDPYVTGEMAAALISGIQSQGIGTSMKHYAANSQETRRMSTDSVVDERALREIYLTGFETAVKKAQPWTLMCAYNKLDGTYLSNNKRLLTDILREEWGFEGLVMTDWGAMDDRVKGVEAGLDLEMPASGGFTDTQIVEAVRAGKLSEAALDRAVERITALILRCQEGRQAGYRYDRDAHHALARRAAAQSTVLLKNEGGLLPLAGNARIAVIGQFAKTPRYQGAGSSKIEPTRLDNAWDALAQTALEAEYAPGYNLGKERQDAAALRAGACKAARDKDVVVLFAGLPDAYESEGFDRDTLEMPQEHVDLIEAVAAENPNVVVVLQCGAPVEMDWADRVKGIVLSYLGGQAGGSGCVDVLTGKVNPGGKLAETFPYHLSDTPSFRYFPGYSKSVEYRESLYVGYRYYDAADKAVRYPFGYGLSYTTFEYSNLKLGAAEYEPGGGTLAVSFTVTNTGTVPGAEVAQIYVGLEKSRIFRAKRELKGFQKVFLQPGESRAVNLRLDRRSFAYYNVPAKDWAVEQGLYTVSVGTSSRDIRLSAPVQVAGDGKERLLAETYAQLSVYFQPARVAADVPDAQFTALLGRPLPPREHRKGEPFTKNSTIGDVKDTLAGKLTLRIAGRVTDGMAGDSEELRNIMEHMVLDAPLRAMLMMGGDALTPRRLDGMLDCYNGRYLKGIGKFLKK